MNDTLTYADLQDTGNAQSQLVLFAVARNADWETGETFACVKRLADMAKCSEKTCRRHLDRLEEDGFIEREDRKRQDGGRASNLIRLAGYKSWFEINRKGGRLNKPRSAPKYDDPPGQSDQGPTGQTVTTPPGQQGDQGKIITKNKKVEKRISDFQKIGETSVRDTSVPFPEFMRRAIANGTYKP